MSMESNVSHSKRKCSACLLAIIIISTIIIANLILANKMRAQVNLKPTPSNNTHDETRKVITDQVVDKLKAALDQLLSLPPKEVVPIPRYCEEKAAKGNSCNGKCLRESIDEDVRTRISQLVEPSHLQLSPYYHEILTNMSQKVKGKYDIILVTGASTNHFVENQSLLKSVHKNVVPFVKNFTIIYYDLGLSSSQRSEVEKHCQCQVVDFPFDKFPKFFKTLRCYSWKPVVIKAHMKQANVVVWADSSIRYKPYPAFVELVDRARVRGLQFSGGRIYDEASRTLPSMFHFFGEEACAYISFGEIASGFVFYKSDFLIERLVMEPWVACALDRRCMCPNPIPKIDIPLTKKMMADWKKRKSNIKYGLAHRFDQSALNILVAKIFRERMKDGWIAELDKFLDVKRGQKINYFPNL